MTFSAPSPYQRWKLCCTAATLLFRIQKSNPISWKMQPGPHHMPRPGRDICAWHWAWHWSATMWRCSKFTARVFPVFLLAMLRFAIGAVHMARWIKNQRQKAPLPTQVKWLVPRVSVLVNFVFHLYVVWDDAHHSAVKYCTFRKRWNRWILSWTMFSVIYLVNQVKQLFMRY